MKLFDDLMWFVFGDSPTRVERRLDRNNHEALLELERAQHQQQEAKLSHFAATGEFMPQVTRISDSMEVTTMMPKKRGWPKGKPRKPKADQDSYNLKKNGARIN